MALGDRAARWSGYGGGRERERERAEVTGDWRELHNEERHVVFWSPSDNRVIGWSCGTNGGKGFWWGSVMRRHHLEDLVIDGRIILQWL